MAEEPGSLWQIDSCWYGSTSGKEHITDSTKRFENLLFNIHSLKWDDQLVGLLDIPKCILSQV